jgi:hypothetical protein
MKAKLWWVAAIPAIVVGCGGGADEGDAAMSTQSQSVAGETRLSLQAETSSDSLFDPAAAAPVTAAVDTSSLTGTGNSHVAIGPDGTGLMFYLRDYTFPDEPTKRMLFGRSINAAGQLGPERLIESGGVVKDLRVKFDADGSAVMVWTKKLVPGAAGGQAVARLASFSAGLWFGAETVSVAPASSGAQYTEVERPDVAFSPDGQFAFLSWTERTHYGNGSPDRFRTMTASATAHGNVAWNTTSTIYDLGTAFRDSHARIAVLPDNSRVVVVREQGQPGGAHQLVIYRAGPNKPWGPGNLLAEPSYYLQNMPAGEVLDFDLAANAAGQVTVVWRHSFPAESGRTAIFATRLQPSGAWSNPMLVDIGASESSADPSLGKSSTDPRVVVDALGNALFAWRQQDAVGSNIFSLYSARYDAAQGGFETRPLLLETRSQLTIGAPALTLNPDGHGAISWVQDVGANGEFSFSLFARRFDGVSKTFGSPALVEGAAANVTSFSPGAALSPSDGRLLAIWMQGGRVMFNRSH